VHGQPISPQEIAAHILRSIRKVAEEALGEPVTRAVVTVRRTSMTPAPATRDAGQIAGIDVVRILKRAHRRGARIRRASRPRGSPDHRGVRSRRRARSTFSLMSVENGIFEVLATGGDTALGGEDWDRRVLERIVDEMFDQYRVDLTAIPMAMSRLASVRREREEGVVGRSGNHDRATVSCE